MNDPIAIPPLPRGATRLFDEAPGRVPGGAWKPPVSAADAARAATADAFALSETARCATLDANDAWKQGIRGEETRAHETAAFQHGEASAAHEHAMELHAGAVEEDPDHAAEHGFMEFLHRHGFRTHLEARAEHEVARDGAEMEEGRR